MVAFEAVRRRCLCLSRISLWMLTVYAGVSTCAVFSVMVETESDKGQNSVVGIGVVGKSRDTHYRDTEVLGKGESRENVFLLRQR